MINKNIDALNPTEAGCPIAVMKNTDAPSLIPNSPNETGGIIDFENITRLPVKTYCKKCVSFEKDITRNAY